MVNHPAIRWQGTRLILQIVVQPRASKDELVELNEQGLKVRITAPPVDGKANKHLIRFLAKTFKVPVSRVELLSGEKGRHKRLAIESPETLPALFELEE